MHVYFVGIAGAGMSALASVLASQGVRVSGSDQGVFPPVSDYLDARKIPWRDGFDAALTPADVDLAIVGGSARLDLATNPEVAALRGRGVPCESFPAFLGRHTQGRDNIVIAGSFGKSTITALVTVMLREAGRDPGYFIGAVPLDLDATGHWGEDKVFVIEGDEYIVGPEEKTSKFLKYHPQSLLISSIIHDHVNVFPTMESYEAAFAGVLDLLPRKGLLVCAAGFPALARLTAGRDAVWYSREPGAAYHAERVQIGEITAFELATPTGEKIPLRTELLGLHNIENIVGAAALLHARGDIDAEGLVAAVKGFRGVERRLDKKTVKSKVPVFEGFGSSYEKARSAIEAVRLHFTRRRLVVVFEPHTFSWRNVETLSWYDTVFAGVDEVLLLPPPSHGADARTATKWSILERIGHAGIKVRLVSGGEEALGALKDTLRGDEVVLLLSSGPLDGLARSAPAMIEARFA